MANDCTISNPPQLTLLLAGRVEPLNATPCLSLFIGGGGGGGGGLFIRPGPECL